MTATVHIAQTVNGGREASRAIGVAGSRCHYAIRRAPMRGARRE